MGVLLGPFDPLQLIFNILNVLLKKGLITYDEARSILMESLNPQMPTEEKEKVLDSLIKRT
jgi:hypothetical protein